MSSHSHPRLTELREAEIAEYHPLSKLAVAGLIFGLAAPAAIVDPTLWALPPLGAALNGLALWHVARNAPVLLGRRAALAGLMLSILFGTAAPTHWFGYRWMLRREARQFAEAWFELVRRGEPHKAYQLTIMPTYRQPLDENLWSLYRESPHWRGELESYVSTDLIRGLLTLGQQARVRYYDTEAFRREQGQPIVYLWYAVTYDDAGEKKTFFVNLKLQRVKLPNGRANWRLARTASGGVPQGL